MGSLPLGKGALIWRVTMYRGSHLHAGCRFEPLQDAEQGLLLARLGWNRRW